MKNIEEVVYIKTQGLRQQLLLEINEKKMQYFFWQMKK